MIQLWVMNYHDFLMDEAGSEFPSQQEPTHLAIQDEAAQIHERKRDRKKRITTAIRKRFKKPDTTIATSEQQVENTSEEIKFRTKAKEKAKEFIKNYAHNLNPKGKDGYWWAGALGKLGATVTTAIFAPFAAPAVALSTASFRVGQFGAEKFNNKRYKKKLTDEGYSEWLQAREKKYPKGVSRIGRLARGTSAASVGAAIGLAA